MTLFWACFLWICAAAGAALLPPRHRYIPGLSLMLAAPVLLGGVVARTGWLPGALALCAFLSISRAPLCTLLKQMRGSEPELGR
ncbi:DUF2484 family protein [Sulfitobacter aestuarii]|uniref:DUF2484 family protein n=1 Tax=Sulfitobacter aestuarii TaxID=2161676 RepID=A0ABW5TYK7_9RHOB